MRLWHQSLIPSLPRMQLLGCHRETCALRGRGWAKSHSVVDYVFRNNPHKLFRYHQAVMAEMRKRGYHPDILWDDPLYRGKHCNPHHDTLNDSPEGSLVYIEHNDRYYRECVLNLYHKVTSALPGKYKPEEIGEITRLYETLK